MKKRTKNLSTSPTNESPRVGRKPKKAARAGVSVKDLVGTIKLTEDPVEFQRRTRDEWV